MTIKLTQEQAVHYIGKVEYKDAFEYEAMKMAIEALEGVCFDEWCDDCKEYDTEKKCCPRFNKVIRGAMNREPNADGTLEVKVEDATKVGRVLISDDEHRGGLYYPDEDEPKRDDLISRADAIEAITGALDAIDHVPKWVFDKLTCAINILPSADRPRGEWTLLTEERPVDGYEIIATVYWPGYGDSAIAVGHIDRFDNWHLYSPTEGELIKGFEVIAWKTLPEPYCGADMRSE